MIVERHAVSDVNAAIALLRELSSGGRFDLFRGQRDARWGITPTAMRLEEAEYRTALEQIMRFAYFCRRVLSSLGITYDWDDILAIAQHYGMATNLVDFTSSVKIAAFFATDLPAPAFIAAPAESGVLFATSRAAVASAVASIPDGLLRLVEVDTANLWRLQAQQGLFIERREYNSDPVPMVAIEFRHRSDPALVVPRSSIYPDAKSALELHLDGFFGTEERQKSRRFWMEELKMKVIRANPPEPKATDQRTTPRITAHDITLTEAELAAEKDLHEQLSSFRDYPPYRPLRLLPAAFYKSQLRFVNDSLRPHDSWFEAERWRAWSIEMYSHSGAGGPAIEITYCGDADSFESLRAVFNSQFSDLGDLKSKRGRTARFSFSGPHDENVNLTRIGRNLQLLWDGLRTLPVADALVCRALAAYCAWEAQSLLQRRPAVNIFEEAHGGAEDQGFFRAECVQIGHPVTQYYFASRSAETMLRSDLFEQIQIVGEFAPRSLSAWLLSQIIYPQYLFDFERFAEVYLTEAVPASLAIYGAFAPCFNPLQTKVFGHR